MPHGAQQLQLHTSQLVANFPAACLQAPPGALDGEDLVHLAGVGPASGCHSGPLMRAVLARVSAERLFAAALCGLLLRGGVLVSASAPMPGV